MNTSFTTNSITQASEAKIPASGQKPVGAPARCAHLSGGADGGERRSVYKKLALSAAALILASFGAGQAALGQGMQAGQAGSLNQTSSLGADQDSLLPPEVVPLDPTAANRMMQSQAQSRAAQMSMPETQASAGMLTAYPQMNGMQTAQDARKAAYDQLMEQSQAPPINRAYQGQYPGMQGGQPVNPGFNNNGGMGNAGYGAPYQPQQMANNYAGPSGPAGSTGQSGWVQPGAAGSQTLTGGVKYAPQKRDIRRAGFSNAMSAVAGIGTGLFLGSLVSRSYYSSPIGLGMLGLGMTGFGTRNGFRF